MGIGGLADLVGAASGGASSGIPAATQRLIEVDDKELPEEIDRLVESVVVIDRLHMPDSCVLTIRDYRHKVLEEAGIEIGTRIRISTTEPGGESTSPLFYGEVTSIEAEYDVLGMRAIVRGYDLLHRLAGGRKTKVFKNVTYADVAKEIAEGAFLDADVEDTSDTFKHLIQPNVSDLEFLQQIAARVGYDVGVEEETLTFKRPADSSAGPDEGDTEQARPTQLVWSKNLLEFRGRMSAVAQVTEVKVRGWDVAKKQAVIGKADADTTTARLAMTPVELAEAVSGEALVVVDRPVDDQGAADNLAKAFAEQVASSAYEATAVAVGSPELRAGTPVSIAEVDKQLKGKWVITTARHEFGSDGPYRTHLEFSGRQDRSLHGLVVGGTNAGSARSKLPGIAIGIVIDNEDPEKMGRIKVRFPWLGDDAESWWARLATIGAGRRKSKNGHGVMWIPEVDEEVIVAFEHGDVAHPIVIGSVWNGQDKPPESFMSDLFDGGEVKKVGLISRDGHGLLFHDTDDNAGVVLGTADGKQFLGLDEKSGTITLSSDGRKLTIEATGDIEIKADGSMTLQAGANMTIKGAKVAIN